MPPLDPNASMKSMIPWHYKSSSDSGWLPDSCFFVHRFIQADWRRVDDWTVTVCCNRAAVLCWERNSFYNCLSWTFDYDEVTLDSKLPGARLEERTHGRGCHSPKRRGHC
jgi:hypothetical protein